MVEDIAAALVGAALFIIAGMIMLGRWVTAREQGVTTQAFFTKGPARLVLRAAAIIVIALLLAGIVRIAMRGGASLF